MPIAWRSWMAVRDLLGLPERPWRDFVGLLLEQFGGEAAVAQVGGRQAVRIDARRSAGVRGLGDGLVPFQGFLPAVALDPHQLAVDPLGPLAEVVNLAPDFLPPGSGC